MCGAGVASFKHIACTVCSTGYSCIEVVTTSVQWDWEIPFSGAGGDLAIPMPIVSVYAVTCTMVSIVLAKRPAPSIGVRSESECETSC